MSKSYDKLARRLAMILIKLNSGERFTATELAKEFNVSDKTIYRDMHERLLYLPIKKEHGYYSMESYALGKLGFDDIKNFAAISGVKSLFPSLSKDFIIDLLNTRLNKIYLVKEKGHEDLTKDFDTFECLSAAVATHNKVNFIYKDKKRTANPYKLVNTNGIWYLVADEAGKLKHFSFSKIVDLKKLESTFTPDKGLTEIIEKNELTWFSQVPIEVILQIDISVASYFQRRMIFPNQQIIEQTDEHLTLSTKVAYDMEILGTVKYWLPHIKIISPVSLQRKLEEMLQGYLSA